MSAFAAAAQALHADPNLGVPALLTPAASGAALPVRVIRASPVVELDGGPFGARTARREEASLAAADLPADPAEGDLLQIGAETWVVEAAQLDPEGACWTLRLGAA